MAWLLTGVALNAAAQIGLKFATLAVGPIADTTGGLRRAATELAAVPAFWASLAAYGVSVACWVVGLSRVPLSQAYPLLSIGYVLTALAAWLLLHERISAVRLCGIATILVGVILVSRS